MDVPRVTMNGKTSGRNLNRRSGMVCDLPVELGLALFAVILGLATPVHGRD